MSQGRPDKVLDVPNRLGSRSPNSHLKFLEVVPRVVVFVRALRMLPQTPPRNMLSIMLVPSRKTKVFDFNMPLPTRGRVKLIYVGLLPVNESTLPRNDSLSGMGDIHESSEMEADRIQDMLDFDIPKLTRWSDKLYGILSSLGGNQPDIDGRAKLNSYRKSYNHARLPFTNGNTPFIKHVNLPEEYDEGVRSKIHIAICSGNLVSLLILLFDIESEKKNSHTILKHLDGTFPASFVSRPQVDSGDVEKIFDLAFRIRCCRLIELLDSDDSITSPEGYLTFATTIFCRESIDGADQAREALDQGPYKPLAGMEISEGTEFYRPYCERIREFFSKIVLNDIPEFHASLDSKFTEESIFNNIKSWALEMYLRLNGLADRNKIRSTNENTDSRAPIERAESEPLFVGNVDTAGIDSDSASDGDSGGYNQLPLHGPKYAQSFLRFVSSWI